MFVELTFAVPAQNQKHIQLRINNLIYSMVNTRDTPEGRAVLKAKNAELEIKLLEWQ
jgi:hypothetical protein